MADGVMRRMSDPRVARLKEIIDYLPGPNYRTEDQTAASIEAVALVESMAHDLDALRCDGSSDGDVFPALGSREWCA